jgi:chromosome segregation ATPase
MQISERERTFYTLQTKKQEWESNRESLLTRILQIEDRKKELALEYIQAENFVGASIIDLKGTMLGEEVQIDLSTLKTMHHDIERMKIRLEDMGGGGGGDIMLEYDETTNRDQFLEKEITDLKTALETLVRKNCLRNFMQES